MFCAGTLIRTRDGYRRQGGVIANGQLPAIVERIEKLEADRSATTVDIREMYVEAKGQGYNVKALQRIVRERRQDAAERAEIEMAMEAYRVQLGMVARAVGNGEMSIRQAEEVSGFSRSAIHREVSHRQEGSFSGTADAPTADAEDNLAIPTFLKRDTASA